SGLVVGADDADADAAGADAAGTDAGAVAAGAIDWGAAIEAVTPSLGKGGKGGSGTSAGSGLPAGTVMGPGCADRPVEPHKRAIPAKPAQAASGPRARRRRILISETAKFPLRLDSSYGDLATGGGCVNRLLRALRSEFRACPRDWRDRRRLPFPCVR